MKVPEIITPQLMLHSTYYDKMANEERHLVFKAYKYDADKKVYRLTNPECLTERIIKIISN